MARREQKSLVLIATLVAGWWTLAETAIAEAQPAAPPPEPAVPPPPDLVPPPPAGETAAPTASQPTPPPAAPVIVPPSSPIAVGPTPPPMPDPKAFSAGAWMRIGGRVQNPSSPNELNDFWLNELYLIAAFRGQVTDWLKWQINLNGNIPPPTSNMTTPSVSGPPTAYASVGIQDLIVKVEPNDLVNVWVGRMIVPLDRANLSGPWFINYWTFPGFFGNRAPPPVGTRANQNGRDPGVTLWGQVAKGQFKYYLGAFNLDNQEHVVNPLVTARLVLNLLDPEPGYYNQSAYHGDKNILAVGGGFQYQKNGAVSPAAGVGNRTTVEVNLLADKALGPVGVGTLEASGYFFDERQPIRRFFVLGAGYVTPQAIGVGRLCPAVRYQFTQDTELRQFDVYVSYLIRSHFAKFMAGFFYADYPGPMGGPKVKSKAVQLGVQIIKF